MKLSIGKYDKGNLIEKYGWEFVAQLESDIQRLWPQENRDEAIKSFGFDKVQKLEKDFIEDQVQKEENRLDEYYGRSKYYDTKTIHYMYDDDEKYTSGQILNLVNKRIEYEQFMKQNQTDRLIFNSAVTADEKQRCE